MGQRVHDPARRVIVCGSRGWRDRELIARVLARSVVGDATIVHGGASGADRIAAQEAEKLGLAVEAHPADWQRYGKGAGPIRNEEMAVLGATRCIAFWDGKSSGTADMIERCRAHGIPVHVVPADV